MARKTKTVLVEAEGRDKGKSYLLTEMPVYKTEKWAARALLAVSSVIGPDAVADSSEGFGGLANINFSDLSKVPFELAEPLLDEMMECVKFCPNPSDLNVTRPILPEADDIEEITTMLTLRKEILGLHFNFFSRAGASN
jgi:hypothetical protein